MSTVMSLRLGDRRLERLRRAARAMNRTAGEMVSLLVEEGLRLREFPGIEFRDTPIGRQAFLSGQRLGLWQIVLVAREHSDALAATAEHLDITPREVALALAYAHAYSAEIEAAITDIRAANDHLAGLLALEPAEVGRHASAGA